MNPYRKFMPNTIRTQVLFDEFLRSFPYGARRGATIELGCGTYSFRETISVPGYIRFEGSGSGGAWDQGTRITTSVPADPAMVFKSTSNNTISHVTFRDCLGVAFLHTDTKPCHDVLLERVTFHNCERAVLLEATWQARMNDVECIDCGSGESPQIVLANSETAQIAEVMIDSLRCEPMYGTGIYSHTEKPGGNVGMPVQVSCSGAMEFEGHWKNEKAQCPAIVGHFYEARFTGLQCRQSTAGFVHLGHRSVRCVVDGTFVSCKNKAINLQGYGHVVGSATIIHDEEKDNV